MAIQDNRTLFKKGSSNSGVGCLILFALPFAGFGLLGLFQGVKHLLAGNTKDGLPLCLIGTVFSLVGFGLIAGGYYGLRKERGKDKRKTDFPNEPWRWREDWAQGRADSQGATGAYLTWFIALFWNLISTSVLFIIPRELAKGNKGILFALIFPLVGLGLLSTAIYATLQRRKFGRPVCKLLTSPVPLGGQLAGMVEIPAKVKAAHGFKVRLECLERLTTGSGKNRSTRETPLWQDHATVTQDLLAHQADKTAVPVQFTLPRDCPEASWDACNPCIVWRLNITADLPGVDLNETFELPVFRTAESPAAGSEPLEHTPRWTKPVDQYQPPTGTRIRLQISPTGGCVAEFPAARNVGSIIAIMLFGAVFGGALYFMILKHAPIIFLIVFSFVDFIVVVAVLNMLFHSSRIEADGQSLRVTDSWVFFKKKASYTLTEITDIAAKRGMQSGNKTYFDVKLQLKTGREITLGSSVPDMEYATWLAAVIGQAAGLKAKT